MPRYLVHYEFHGSDPASGETLTRLGGLHGFYTHMRNHADRIAYLPPDAVVGFFPSAGDAHAHFTALLDAVRAQDADARVRRYTIANAGDGVFVSGDEVYVGEAARLHPKPLQLQLPQVRTDPSAEPLKSA